MEYEDKRKKVESIINNANVENSKGLDRDFSEALYSASEMGLFEGLTIEYELAMKIVKLYTAVKEDGFQEELRM